MSYRPLGHILGVVLLVCTRLGLTAEPIVLDEELHILFGGCMIKALDAKDLGFSGDADLAAWPKSVRKVLERYPDARIVVPGHGHWRDLELIRHTIRLCER